MPSTQEPIDIADVPLKISELAKEERQITINQRADYWSHATLEELRADRMWQINIALYHGMFMSPELTNFLNTVTQDETVLSCIQDAMGDVFSVIGSVREVYWLACHNMSEKPRGIHAAIRFYAGFRYGCDSQLWGSHILAIAKMRKSTCKTSKKDPDGSHFINLFNTYKLT